MARSRRARPLADYSDLRTRLVSALVLIAIGASALALGGMLWVVFVAVVIGGMIYELFRLNRAAPSINILVLAVLAVLVSGAILIILRNSSGPTWVLWIIVCTVLSDVGGYFVGRFVGGPKLWPAVSPGKTWSGTIGGWVFSMIGAYVFHLAGFGTVSLIVLAVPVAMAAQAGDLAESWMKRRAGVKDMSNLIPGHGGFCDRFDGLTGALLFVGLAEVIGLI